MFTVHLTPVGVFCCQLVDAMTNERCVGMIAHSGRRCLLPSQWKAGIAMRVMTPTSKGQVTVAKSIRDVLRIDVGSKVTFELMPSGDVVLRTDEIIGLARGDR